MIDKEEELLEDKEYELGRLRLELAELDGKSNIPGEEGAAIRRKASELVLKISKLESELQKASEDMRLEMHKPATNDMRMEGKRRIF